ncbi:MAG TPA: AMP-binding protein, partial [Polyangiaceae bacterium]|nr:AMP-binding protein [Polyangiaceae bacterium]
MNESSENPVARTRVALELPFDFYRVPGKTRRLQSYRFTLPGHAGENGSHSNRDASMPDALLTAAFGVLLARYNGQPAISVRLSRSNARGVSSWTRTLDLAIGEAATGRDVLEQARGPLSPSDRAQDRTALGSVQDVAGAQAAITWQESETWWESDREGAGVDGEELGALEMCGGSDADLTLVIGSDDEWRAAFVYDSRLFKRSSIERFAGHLRMLLSNLTTNLDGLVFELPLLLPEEQAWLESVCDGRTRAVPPQLVHQLVERHAAAAPEAIALRFRDQSLTYGELNRRANQLAHYLADRGVGGCRVVVCVEPAFDVVVALLGILKAGAVYVPLDPSYPRARIDTILDDTRPKLIITQQHLKARLEPSSVATLVLDALARDLDVLQGENPHTAIVPEQT